MCVLTLDEIKDTSLAEIIERVIGEQVLLKIRLPDGQTVSIQPEPKLTPLPILEGFVPAGWKDALG